MADSEAIPGGQPTDYDRQDQAHQPAGTEEDSSHLNAMIEQVRSTAQSFLRPLRRIVEVNSELEHSSATRVNTMGSAILSGPAGDESSGENQASVANGARNSSGSNKESAPYTSK